MSPAALGARLPAWGVAAAAGGMPGGCWVAIAGGSVPVRGGGSPWTRFRAALRESAAGSARDSGPSPVVSVATPALAAARGRPPADAAAVGNPDVPVVPASAGAVAAVVGTAQLPDISARNCPGSSAATGSTESQAFASVASDAGSGVAVAALGPDAASRAAKPPFAAPSRPGPSWAASCLAAASPTMDPVTD